MRRYAAEKGGCGVVDEYIRREDVIEWFMPYAHAGESIDADVVISDIKGMKPADVAPVVHGRIVGSLEDGRYRRRFSCCGEDATMITQWAWPKYCPNCGAKIDG